MITIAIANNNDILYNSLSNIYLQNELNIEITKVVPDQLGKLIDQIKTKDELIILDSTTSITFCTNVLKFAIKRLGMKKLNIIILVINSNSISNINTKNYHHIFRKNNTNFKLLDVFNTLSNALKDSIEIERKVDDILWRLGFTSYFKGTIYIKDAILLAHSNNELLLDANKLVQKVAEKNMIQNSHVVRSNMDRALSIMTDHVDKKVIYEIFGNDYDGRTISLRYFIDLCIRYLEKQRYCCLDY